MEIQFDDGAIARMAAQAAAKLQPVADEQLREVVRDVNARMAGQPADDVHAELVRQLADHAMTPVEPTLRSIAAEIEAGTLTDAANEPSPE